MTEKKIEITLPTLTGSEKQIKWAEDIRARVIETMEQCLAEAEKVPENKLTGSSWNLYCYIRKYAEDTKKKTTGGYTEEEKVAWKNKLRTAADSRFASKKMTREFRVSEVKRLLETETLASEIIDKMK